MQCPFRNIDKTQGNHAMTFDIPGKTQGNQMMRSARNKFLQFLISTQNNASIPHEWGGPKGSPKRHQNDQTHNKQNII
jgi:hypothetical protein